MIINSQEIIPLYDPPHLLKGIRNNLLSKKFELTVEINYDYMAPNYCFNVCSDILTKEFVCNCTYSSLVAGRQRSETVKLLILRRSVIRKY